MKYNSVPEIVSDLESNPVERSGHIYHPIPYPEFEHLSTSANKSAVYAKLALITEILRRHSQDGIRDLRILDVGANAGFFTFSLAEEGAHVTAFEPHPRYAPIGQFLAQVKTSTVDWRPVAFDVEAARQASYDVALMLSTFQWITRGNADLGEGKALLAALSTKVDLLIFELGVNSGKSAITTRRFNHLGFIHDLLKRNTTYRHIQLVGKTALWSPSAGRYVFACSNKRIDGLEPWYAFAKRIPL